MHQRIILQLVPCLSASLSANMSLCPSILDRHTLFLVAAGVLTDSFH